MARGGAASTDDAPQGAQVLRRRDAGGPRRRRVGGLDDTAGHGLRGLRAVALRGAVRAARPGQAAAAEERSGGFGSSLASLYPYVQAMDLISAALAEVISFLASPT